MACSKTKGVVLSELIRVIVRCRPMNEKEKKLGYSNAINTNQKEKSVEITFGSKSEKQNSCSSKVFYFNDVYDDKSKTQDIFEENASLLIMEVLDGFNGTIFAYGQSGTGKTFTMEGNELEQGIIQLTFDEIFYQISNSNHVQFLLRASFIEIYQDEIRDLLGKNTRKKCGVRQNKETGVYIENVTTFVCKSVDQLNKLMKLGNKNRFTGATDLNLKSSRSHAIFTITVEITDTGGPYKGRLRVGKLNLVDLAGSERQSKTNSEGQRLKEARKINLTLSALGNVISALAENKNQYIPYRDSKLTRLLRDSLGGNSKTLMIANIGPSSSNCDESLNTLRFASRARQIMNKPQVNEDPDDALLRKYQEEISRLKILLAEKEAAQTEKHLRKRNNIKLFVPHDDEHRMQPFLTECNDKQKREKETIVDIENSVVCRGNSDDLMEETFIKDLAKRIDALESKLLTGSNSIVEYTDIQQKVIEAKTKEIEEVIEREREMEELIELQDETTGEVKEEYSTLQQEIETKRKTLIKLHNKLHDVRQEIEDVKEELNKDREDLLTTETELVKELKLKLLIMENFIPYKSRRQVLSRLYFDEDLDVWRLMPNVDQQLLPLRPTSRALFRRPVTDHVLISRRKVNHLYKCSKSHENLLKTSRYKEENILLLDLCKQRQTTDDFESSKISYELESKFLKACQKECDLDIYANSNSFKVRNNGKRRRHRYYQQCSETSLIRTSRESVPVYPKARGLVPK